LLVLGESTVAGVGAPTHSEALAGQTAAALAARLKRGVAWKAVGRNGVTAQETEAELLPAAPDVAADAVAIALGVNDALHWHSPRRWSRDLASLIAAVHRRCGPGPVFLAAVPPLGRFPALPQPLRAVLGRRAGELAAAAARLAPTLSKVTYVDSRFSGGREMFASDGFHPSPAGYAAWGRELAEVIAGSAEGW
jgi:lysophospholipase L1-like esterase